MSDPLAVLMLARCPAALRGGAAAVFGFAKDIVQRLFDGGHARGHGQDGGHWRPQPQPWPGWRLRTRGYLWEQIMAVPWEQN